MKTILLPHPRRQTSRQRLFYTAKRLPLCALSLLLLTACGGGGGGGGGSVASGPSLRTAPLSNHCASAVGFDAKKSCAAALQEYGGSYSAMPVGGGPLLSGNKYWLGMINADAAYARGATGAGETIAIVDSGIRDTHNEFSGGKVSKDTQSDYTPTDMDKFHGTFVAGLAVGNRSGSAGGNGVDMHGVAFDSTLHFSEIRLGTSDGIYRPLPLLNYNSMADQSNAAFYGNIITTARRQRAAIVNQSFGINGAISTFNRAEVRSRLSRVAGVFAQASTADADKIIIVWAAGNAATQMLLSGGTPVFDSPELYAGLGAYFPELQKNTLAVVALQENGSIANYSNHCGIAKSFCVAAPGTNMVSANSSGDNIYSIGSSGTSFAAPMVSGSLALLRQYFRQQLGNTELVTRLLDTANRTGRYADSDIYGHGLVDLDAATAPVGMLMIGLPGDPGNRPFAGGIALAGGAFGKALQSQWANVEVAAFDSLGAPFFQSAAAWVTQPPPTAGGFGRNYRAQPRIVSLAISPGQTSGATWSPGFNHNRAQWQQRALALASSPAQTSGATLSLGFDHDGTISNARFALADGWWLSYRQHGGHTLGLYDSAGNIPNNINPAFQRNREHGGHAPGLYESASGNAPNDPTPSVPGKRAPAIADTPHFSTPLAFAAPYLSLVRDGAGLGWSDSLANGGRFGFALMHGAPQFDGEQNLGGKRGLGALLHYRLPTAGIALQTGAVREADGFLGARVHGIFGAAHAATTFAGINGAWAVGAVGNKLNRGAKRWRVLASAYFGHTRPTVSGGILRHADNIVSSAFSLGALRDSLWRRGDRFGVRLSQPLRVESGRMKLRLPVGRTKYGAVQYTDLNADLTPTGRAVQAETTYRLPLAGGALTTGIGIQRHPQHNRNHAMQSFINVAFERWL